MFHSYQQVPTGARFPPTVRILCVCVCVTMYIDYIYMCVCNDYVIAMVIIAAGSKYVYHSCGHSLIVTEGFTHINSNKQFCIICLIIRI